MKQNRFLKNKKFLILGGLLIVAIIVVAVISATSKQNIAPTVLHQDLRSKTTAITFHDPKDVTNFTQQLADLDKEIQNNSSGGITFDQIIMKARLLGYLGQPGAAIKLYEENFMLDDNGKSLVYNHNLGRLYETVKEYDLAIQRYEFLIDTYKVYEYNRDIADVYKNRGNGRKYKEYMAKYQSLVNVTKSIQIEAQ